MKLTLSDRITSVLMYILVSIFTISCLYPLLMVFSVSFSKEADILINGYSLIPKHFSVDAFTYIFTVLNRKLLSGYKVTIFITLFGTLASMIISSTYAYSASVKSFRYRNVLNLLVYIPMVFNAGLLPWYILLTRYYHLTNSLFALIVPSLMNLFNVFLIRNFFGNVPVELAEAARMDGAGHFKILVNIYVPVAKVGLITVAMFYALGYWNDFYLALMFMSKAEYYPLQFLLYNMLSNIEFLNSQANTAMSNAVRVPEETIKMALTCVTIGPIMLLYPVMQKFFVKGVIVGAVKG